MSVLRWIIAGCWLAAVVAWSPFAAAAWVETRVKAHTSTVDVESSGTALVSQELTLGVRGGPLRTFEIAGIDPDAELDGSATATPIVKYGVPAPIPLTLAKREDGTLQIEIEREKGLFTGSYVFRFQYKTNLLAREHVRRRGTGAEVEWIGSRFVDGIDVAKVVFRLPEAPIAPTLETSNPDDQSLGSIFLGAVRHSGGKVELELVRPHVARGEPAVWRVLADPKLFAGLPTLAPEAQPMRAARVLPVERPRERAVWGAIAFGLAAAYALLVWLKWRLFARECDRHHAEPRALVRLPIGLRAALAGAALSAGASLFVLGDHPTAAGVAVFVACLLAVQRAPFCSVQPRGPGHWFALNEEDCVATRPSRSAASWLDAGSLRGAGMLLLAALSTLTGAVLLAPRSPFHALALALCALSLLPILLTGRARQLPAHRVLAPRPLLLKLRKRLAPLSNLKVVPWARIPDGQREPDELRLMVRVQGALDGAQGLEVGVEFVPSYAGYWPEPYVLVRVRDATPAHQALLPKLRFQRGRQAEERIAVVKPALPSVAALEVLLRSLADQLASGAPRTKSRNSDGASSVTSKLGIPSPAHAT